MKFMIGYRNIVVVCALLVLLVIPFAYAIPGDSNGDGCVDFGEIIPFVGGWLSGTVSFSEVTVAVSSWLGGCTAAHDRSLLFSQAYDLTWPPAVENEGSYGAESNPTGNPLGGFYGYDRIVSPADADFIVHDKDEFLSALQQVQSGQIIYVDDNSVIDLTGYSGVHIPGNITIASGRGRDFSLGALIKKTDDPYRPPSHVYGPTYLFVTDGPRVRITGLRIEGQDGTTQAVRHSTIFYSDPPRTDLDNYAYYDLAPYKGIITNYPYLEVDNCEFFNWATAAIALGGDNNAAATNSYIHHNYIHNNVHAGLGYGVSVSSYYEHVATALIEANIFDRNRHSIASEGTQGISYEARYNFIGTGGTQQQFDRHQANGWSGNYTIIDHNTCSNYFYGSVCIGISGVNGPYPPDGIQIFNNWMYTPVINANTIFVTNLSGGAIYNNWQNIIDLPPGVHLPIAVLSMDKDTVSVGSSITFSGSGSYEDSGQISYVCVDFGDGSDEECNFPSIGISHTFSEVGRYLITLTAVDPKGVFAKTTKSVIVYPTDSNKVILSFWQRDNYNEFDTNDSPGYFMKQVLVDNVTVWERDPYDDGWNWEHVVVDITPYVHDVSEINFQIKSLQDYSGPLYPENHAFDMYNQYFDDIYVFNRDYSAENFGDWEDSSSSHYYLHDANMVYRYGENAWYAYFEGDPSWTGYAALEDPHSGSRSYMFDSGYREDSTAGSVRGLKQTIYAPVDKTYLDILDTTGIIRDTSSYQVPVSFIGDRDSGDNEILDFFGNSKTFNGINNYLSLPSFDLSRDYILDMNVFLPYQNRDQTLMYASSGSDYIHIYYSPLNKVVIRGNNFETTCSLPALTHSKFNDIVVGKSCIGAACTLSCASNGVVNQFDNQAVQINLAGSSAVSFGGYAGSSSDMFGAIHEIKILAGSIPNSVFVNESASLLQGAWYFRDGTNGVIKDGSDYGYDISLPSGVSFGSDDARKFLIVNKTTTPRITIPRSPSFIVGNELSVELVGKFNDMSERFIAIDGRPFVITTNNKRLYIGISETHTDMALGEAPWYGTYGTTSRHEAINDTWYDVVFTKYDNYLRMYVDGVLEGKVYIPDVSYDNTVVRNITINGYESNTPGRFDGNIERVAIWDRTLTDSDVEALYESSLVACSDSDGDGYGVFPRSGVVNGCRLDGFDCNDNDAGVGAGGC